MSEENRIEFAERNAADDPPIEVVRAAELDEMCHRRHSALAKRVDALESKGRKSFSDDPQELVWTVLMVIVAVVVLPELISLIAAWVRKWGQSSG